MNERGRLRRQVAFGAGGALVLLAVGLVLLRVSRPAGVDSPPQPEPATLDVATGPGDDGAAPATSTERAGEPVESVRSEAGAVAAAVGHAGASQRWLYWTDEQITAAVAEVATPNATDRLTSEILADIGAARDELVESPGRVWWLVHPLAWRVARYDSGEATVEVWLMMLLSASDVAVPQTEWLTATLELEWLDGAWRLDDVRETPGPTPMTGPRDEPWEPEPFDDALAGFTRLGGGEPAVPTGGS
jgi:hypothetical protein